MENITTKDKLRFYTKQMLTEVYKLVTQPMKVYEPQFDMLVSFVHAYQDETIIEDNIPIPTLWRLGPSGEGTYKYPFPRSVEDFQNLSSLIKGEMPEVETRSMKKLPRFGFMGLISSNEYIYAGAWNGIYKISKKDYTLDSIISHKLMCDCHGIACDENFIYSCLTAKDTLVITDQEGQIVDKIMIASDLSVGIDPAIDQYDWRFVSKQSRGSVGCFHFNYIQKFGDEIYLTSRNLGCLVVLNLKTRKVYFRTMNASVVNLIHDGIKVRDAYYFTSIDGQVIIAQEQDEEEKGIYTSDLIARHIKLKRKPNWCRGIAIKDDVIVATVDGRYGMALNFGVQFLTPEGKYIGEKRINFKDVGFNHNILYFTGFDILLI